MTNEIPTNVKLKKSYEEWVKMNPSMVPYLIISSRKSTDNSEQFEKNSYNIHNKLKEKLSIFGMKIEKVKQVYVKELDRVEYKINKYALLQTDSIPWRSNFYYKDNVDNLKVRICIFSREQYLRLRLQFITGYLNTVLVRITQLNHFTELFREYDDGSVCFDISDSFFDVRFNQQLQFQYISMQMYYKRLKKEIIGFKQPLYISNPKKFFINMRDQAYDIGKKNNLQFGNLPDEILFSNYLFKFPSKEGQAIDNFIHESAENGFENFGDNAIKLSCKIIPPSNNSDLNSVSIALIFKQIIDRCYETIYNSKMKENDFNSFYVLRNLPMNKVLPDPSCLDPYPVDTRMADAFLFDPYVKIAIGEFSSSIFYTNPIDILNTGYKAIQQIRSALIMMKLQREPTKEEISTMPPFETIFSIILGVCIASEIPNYKAFANYIKTVTPFTRLTPDCEFLSMQLLAVYEHLAEIEDESNKIPSVD